MKRLTGLFLGLGIIGGSLLLTLGGNKGGIQAGQCYKVNMERINQSPSDLPEELTQLAVGIASSIRVRIDKVEGGNVEITTFVQTFLGTQAKRSSGKLEDLKSDLKDFIQTDCNN